MRAFLPDGNGSVHLDRVPPPEPTAGEAVIGVQAYSVNRGEAFLLDDPRAGWRPGKDVAGVVLRPAADGSGPACGARVVAHLPAQGWAEQVAVPASSLVPLPDDIEPATAAALPLAGLTALRLVRAAGPLIGSRLLITGASGGVGHYVTEIALASGATVTAVCATVERGAHLAELGADVITDLGGTTGPFDVLIESVGGEAFARARNLVEPRRGRVLWLGQASRSPVTIDFFDWVEGTVGAPVIPFDHSRSDRTDTEDLATLVRLVAEGRLHPHIGAVRPWTQTPAVIDDLVARRLVGNAVLCVPAGEQPCVKGP